MVVPFAAGGGADLVARAVAGGLAKRLGQPIIVDNKPGGGATLGADAVAKPRPTATRFSTRRRGRRSRTRT
jgi:tripartite-type tricarboxylate transporter receptor subunit TctC